MKIRYCFLPLLTLILPVSTHAQTLDNIRDLSFGRVAVIDNATQGQFSLSDTGVITKTNHFVVVEAGQPGLFRLSGFPPRNGAFFSSNIIQSTFTPDGPGIESFELISLDFDSYRVTDDAGEVLLEVGGTIQTSGNGNLLFSQSLYTTTFSITIDF